MSDTDRQERIESVVKDRLDLDALGQVWAQEKRDQERLDGVTF